DHAEREDAAHARGLQPLRRAEGDRRGRHRAVARPAGHRQWQVRGAGGERIVSEACHTKLIIRSSRVVLPDRIVPASIEIQDGLTVRIDEGDGPAPPGSAHDFGDLVISPGIVDTHVHVNEPGRTDWEGFDTATRAAAVGGVTTIVDMPLNSIPATTT